MNSFSIFDCLAIGKGIQTALGSFSPEELHIFGYLGCLLSLYRKQPISEWGYSFILSKEGIPFSHDISQSFNYICQLGYLNPLDRFYYLSANGDLLLEQLKSLILYHDRLPMIEGACASLLAIPMNVIRTAVTNVPEIKRATAIKAARSLLMESSMEQLYEQFRVLSTTFGIDITDLMIPATAWLTYLAQEG